MGVKGVTDVNIKDATVAMDVNIKGATVVTTFDTGLLIFHG